MFVGRFNAATRASCPPVASRPPCLQAVLVQFVHVFRLFSRTLHASADRVTVPSAVATWSRYLVGKQIATAFVKVSWQGLLIG